MLSRASGESRLIGPYRALETIGRGGMGIVYRAQRSDSEQIVALKTASSATPSWFDGIRREIRALCRISHPGVVHLIAHGVHEGRPWYAMDLLEGENLEQLGARIWSPYRNGSPAQSGVHDLVTQTMTGPPDATDSRPPEATSDVSLFSGGRPLPAAGQLVLVIRIIRSLLDTLAYLHGEGFVDCDLTPGNVVVTGDKPVIIDLGLTTRHPGGSGRESEVGVQLGPTGTLPYMSPEQIRGEYVDARSDLYAVGCVFYELLVGRPPFVGQALAVRHQHLTALPQPPSRLVEGIPPGLDDLICKLLEKEPGDRYGYADEVAATLATMIGDTPERPGQPAPRSYLYRPRFVGRDAIVQQLGGLRDRAAAGTGLLVLLAGESGSGKTRLAMELTRQASARRMKIVVSEGAALAGEGGRTATPAPLYPVRPLLQAIADRCQQDGPAMTARLVGHRRSVLAVYEPLLAHVPSDEPLEPVIALGAEASRRRLFKYLAETLSAFAREQPLLWVIDDLGWADELTFAFLASLSAEFLTSTPALILGTHRKEEVSDGIPELAALPHVTRVSLPCLDAAAVRQMVSDMLAVHDPPEGFVRFLANKAEGNAFFVAELLRAAVIEGIIHRDHHAWHLRSEAPDRWRDGEPIGLPSSLADLLKRRLRTLSPQAQAVGVAAAVLGREAGMDLLRDVAGLPADTLEAAVDELVHRYIVDQLAGGPLRFAHDKLREVIYQDASKDWLLALHGRAAEVLERRAQDIGEGGRHWATLGHHFSAAKRPVDAARCLRLAADYARSTFANADAIRLHREGIAQIGHAMTGDPPAAAWWSGELRAQHEILGDLLALTSRRTEAREAYRQVLALRTIDGDVADARLHRKVGKTWETDHEHDAALSEYEVARQTIARVLDENAKEAFAEWIQVHVDELWVHYWLNDVAKMDHIIGVLKPHIDTRAAPLQRANFFQTRMLFNFRRDRYLVNEETLGFARAAVDASKETTGMTELPTQFTYGLASLIQGSIERAQTELDGVYAFARKVGDTGLQARALTYLALAQRLRKNVAGTRTLTALLAQAAAASGMLEYEAAARANEAWLALGASDFVAAHAHASAAVDMWTRRVFPFEWMARLPLLQVELVNNNLEGAAVCARGLLAPTQQFLSGDAADALARGLRYWSAADGASATAAFIAALKQLERTGQV